MGLFNKLFSAKQAAPQCDIHVDDRDLVRSEDMEWWSSLSFNDCKGLEQEDSVFRFAAWCKFVEREGLSDTDAGKKVRIGFPSYYWKLEHRADEKFSLGDADAKLPFVLKDRVNRALMMGIIDKQAIADSSSFNALVRQILRAGRI